MGNKPIIDAHDLVADLFPQSRWVTQTLGSAILTEGVRG